MRAVYGNRTETTISVYNTATNGPVNNNVSDIVEICGYAYQRDPVDNPGRLAVM